MCGIVYNYNFDGSSVSNRVLKQFKRQKSRGTTSFGFALPDKHINNWKVKYEDIAKALRRTVNPEVLFHHRFSTSTADRPTACHPFSTKEVFDNEFVGVHNGVLYNEHELYAVHKERFPGLRYVSDNGTDFNDSEAYIYDLASYFTGLTNGIEMTGYGAFVIVEYDKETHERLRLHWGTTDPSSAPLHVHHTHNHLDIASKGKGWLVEKDVHYVYEYKSGDITTSPLVHTPRKSQFTPYHTSSWEEDDDDIVYHVPREYVDRYGLEEELEEAEIMRELERMYPNDGPYYHYGRDWESSDEYLEQMEVLPIRKHYPDHDLIARTRKSVEAVIVDRVLAKRAA